MPAVRVRFGARARALEPVCVAGVDEVANALAERVLRGEGGNYPDLRGVTAGRTLLLLGAAASLPWVDGAVYLGRDADAPLLLVPTQLRPDVAMDVLQRAALRRAHALVPPVAVLLRPPRLLSVADARPVDHEKLRAWLEAPP